MAKKNQKLQRQKDEAIQMLLILVAGSTYLYTKSTFITGLLVGLVMLFIILFVIIKSQRKRTVLRKSGISEIDSMDGIQFEHYLKELFLSMGYKASVTDSRGDYGADLILKKDDKKVVVQAKRYSKNVGIKAVQEIIGAHSYYKADESWVVSNSHFTKSAKDLAQSSNVRLIDRDELIKSIVKLNPEAIPSPEKIKTEVSPKEITCSACKNKMILRKSKKGSFYGCINFPHCRNTKPFI